ncbi:MAG: hypothetical protein FJ095_21260 [Deltaproteobacteria bacterium]|nr:hypothetical protein [Deltaproteobacteria bacterium]
MKSTLYTSLASTLAVAFLAAPALADEGESSAPAEGASSTKAEQSAADDMQSSFERPLLIRVSATNSTNMPGEAFETVKAAVEQKRMDVRTFAVDSDETKAWCASSAKKAEENAGDTDAKGDAIGDLETLKKRCSAVFTHTLEASHSCKPAKNNSFDCTVEVTITLTKYNANIVDGKVDGFSVDQKFGKGGSLTITSSGGGNSKDQAAAIKAAAFTARLFAERKVRDVEYFQIKAPIQNVVDGYSEFCVGKDSLELDQPFYVLKLNDQGEKERTGWGKVREMKDGCVMTTELTEAEGNGQKIVLGPSRMVNLIGADNIKAGMTAWEMPSVGLNVGAQIGVSNPAAYNRDSEIEPVFGMAPRFDLAVEYNLARHIGVSELHAAIHTGFTLQTNLFDIDNKESFSFNVVPTDIGVTKRFQKRRFIFDVGAFVAYDRWLGEGQGEANAVGGAVKLGIGAQLSPRLIMRLGLGFRGLYNFDLLNPYMGPVGNLGFLYNI